LAVVDHGKGKACIDAEILSKGESGI